MEQITYELVLGLINELTINIEKLLPGIYIFYLNSTDKTLSFKFIK